MAAPRVWPPGRQRLRECELLREGLLGRLASGQVSCASRPRAGGEVRHDHTGVHGEALAADQALGDATQNNRLELSNSSRGRSAYRHRPGGRLEKIEWFGTSPSRPIRTA